MNISKYFYNKETTLYKYHLYKYHFFFFYDECILRLISIWDFKKVKYYLIFFKLYFYVKKALRKALQHEHSFDDLRG
jgi:hypothetical protein